MMKILYLKKCGQYNLFLFRKEITNWIIFFIIIETLQIACEKKMLINTYTIEMLTHT